MNREEAMQLGIPEEKYKEFQERYNRDLNTRVKTEMERRGKGSAKRRLLCKKASGVSSHDTLVRGSVQSTSPAFNAGQQEAEKVRHAIRAALPMVKDERRLLFLLDEVNRQRHFELKERWRKRQSGKENVQK